MRYCHLGAAVVAAILAAFPAWATPLGSNIIANGGAETGSGGTGGVVAIPSWATTSNFTAVTYGVVDFPTVATATAIGGGNNFLAGGAGTGSSTATQTINISDLAAQIDAGTISATLSGFLGGYASQNDNMVVTATFLDAGSASLGSLTIGPVTAADRGNVTDLLARTSGGAVPALTRSVVILLDATRTAGSFDDGYADNIGLVLSSSAAPIAEPGGVALLGVGLLGLGLLRRRPG